MIAGTMVFEDQAIHWQLLTDDRVRYTVTDAREGDGAEVYCTWQQFAAAMALAIGSDELPGAEKLYPLAEAAMPEESMLRWIP